jgi:cyclin T
MRYYSRAELDLSPSRRAGMDAKKETQFRWAACELIKDTGMRLKVYAPAGVARSCGSARLRAPVADARSLAATLRPQLTIATATVFCHRFYALNSHTRVENDWQQVSAACLFLAGKVEETPKALRDVVSMAYLLRHRKEQDKAQEAIKNKARPTRSRCAARSVRRAPTA